MRRAAAIVISAWLVASCATGCVTGGSNDEPTAPRRDGGLDDVEGEFDEGIVEDAGEDAIVDEDAVPDAEEDAAPGDTEPPDAPVGADTLPPPDMGSACTPSCTSCGADDGCGTKCLTGACAAGQICNAGTCVTTVTATRSFLSPGDYAFGTAWARAITWTIDSEGPAKIFYTLDGSAPGPTSASRAAPADLVGLATGTTIRWYADNGARETAKSFVANIDTAGRANYGFILERTNLNGSGPVVVVAPNATVSGTAAFEAWTGTSCPACGMQLVYGVGDVEAACMYNGSPGNYGTSGLKGTGTIGLQAPGAAGTYDLNVTYTLQLDCASAKGTNPLLVRPTARIGVIIVK